MPDKVYKTLNSQMRILRSRGLLISGSRDKDMEATASKKIGNKIISISPYLQDAR